MKDMDELFGDFPNLTDLLDDLAEDNELFVERRNIFLDHLLARFNEQFNEYVLLMYSLSGEASTGEDLIFEKG